MDLTGKRLMPCALSPQGVEHYHEHGFVIARKMFDSEEIELLGRAMAEDPLVQTHRLERADAEGGSTGISLWNRAGDSVYGLAARSARMVDTAEVLLRGDVYHYQSKLTAKDPYTGGAWEWHQDYGYWYYNGCLFPQLLSCMVALDRCDRENGCLQVLRGSHALGRLDHVPLTDAQNSVDPDHLEQAEARLETVHCELDPGDVLLFHCNTLHRSDQNRSAKRRWTFIVCYNRVSNDTFTREDDRYYVPMVKVDDRAIREAGLTFANGDEHFTSKPYVPDVSKTT